MGIKSLTGMNEASLGKWLWRLGDKSKGLWTKVLMAKYGNQRDGWETKDSRYKFSLMRKGKISVKEKFMQNIKYQVRSEKILFWKDTWIGECPPAKKFPKLFNCALVKEAKVKSYFAKGTNREVIWYPIFRRNLRDIEERQFLSLINVLRDVLIPEEGEDARI